MEETSKFFLEIILTPQAAYVTKSWPEKTLMVMVNPWHNRWSLIRFVENHQFSDQRDAEGQCAIARQFRPVLREHVVHRCLVVRREGANVTWDCWGVQWGCGSAPPKRALVCKILHTSSIFGLSEKELVCKILHTIPWGVIEPTLC